MIRKSLLCACILFYSAVPLSAQTIPESSVAPQSDRITVPLAATTARTSLIALDVKINGKGPYPFLLDTGAAINLLEPDLAAELGITATAETAAGSDGKKTVKAGVAQIDRAEFGGGSIENSPCIILALPKKLPFRGVLGADVFKKYVVSVDYAAHTLALFEPKTFTYAGQGIELPLQFNTGDPRPIMTGAIDGNAGHFLVDTGNNGALLLEGSFIKTHDLKKKYRTHLHQSRRATVTGEETSSRTREPNLKLGPNEISHVPTMLLERAQATKSGLDGNIGGEILQRFTVTFDYAHTRAYLEPNANFTMPFQASGAGFAATPEATYYKVVSVEAHGAAAKAGLKVGDRLLQINGKETAQIDLLQLAEMLGQPDGSQVKLTVQTGAKIHDLTLTLKEDY